MVSAYKIVSSLPFPPYFLLPPSLSIFLWFPTLSDIFALLSSFGLQQWSCSGLHIVVEEYRLENFYPGSRVSAVYAIYYWGISSMPSVSVSVCVTCFNKIVKHYAWFREIVTAVMMEETLQCMTSSCVKHMYTNTEILTGMTMRDILQCRSQA